MDYCFVWEKTKIPSVCWLWFFSKQAVREFLLQANEIGRNSLLVWGLDLWSDKRKQFEDDTLPLRWGEKQYSYKMTCQEQLSPSVAKLPTEMENKLNWNNLPS